MAKSNRIPLPVQTPNLTVDEAAEDFLERDFTPNTRRNFECDLRRFRADYGKRGVETVTRSEVSDHLASLKGRGKKPAAPETVNRHRTTLHSLYEWLIREEELDVNPVARAERKKTGNRLPRPMTSKQVKSVFSNLSGLRERTLFSLLYRSGLRIQEALSLDIEDVNFPSATFRVIGKGDDERAGYLSEETRPLLRRYLRGRGKPKEGPLFASRQGRLSYGTARLMFNKAASGLKNPDGSGVTIHQLRHSFGSERAGKMDALVLRDLMGHTSLRTTLQYAKVNPDRTRLAFQQFDRQSR